MRRKENIEWVKELPLTGFSHRKVERRIFIATTRRGEVLAMQYPGKESAEGERTVKNPWDFRPKVLKGENRTEGEDLTFEQIWDPLFEEFANLSGEVRKEVGAVLATLYYRIAYLAGSDYNKSMEDSYATEPFKGDRYVDGTLIPESPTVGPFWNYKPPVEAVDFVEARLKKPWGGMSFEAFLIYNSLLAWNEDMKCVDNYNGWQYGDKRGRMNTLGTYIRVIGFILGEVKPSTLLGGFTRSRGMSPAEDEEIRSICKPFIT